jgi:hypothetical protein
VRKQHESVRVEGVCALEREFEGVGVGVGGCACDRVCGVSDDVRCLRRCAAEVFKREQLHSPLTLRERPSSPPPDDTLGSSLAIDRLRSSRNTVGMMAYASSEQTSATPSKPALGSQASWSTT